MRFLFFSLSSLVLETFLREFCFCCVDAPIGAWEGSALAFSCAMLSFVCFFSFFVLANKLRWGRNANSFLHIAVECMCDVPNLQCKIQIYIDVCAFDRPSENNNSFSSSSSLPFKLHSHIGHMRSIPNLRSVGNLTWILVSCAAHHTAYQTKNVMQTNCIRLAFTANLHMSTMPIRQT